MGSEDNDDSSRDDHRTEDNHLYPPTPSAGSSVGQLDAQMKTTNESEPGNYGATVKSPALNPQKDPTEVESSPDNRDNLSRPKEEEEEDAWDNWKEESKSDVPIKDDS